MVEDKVYIQSLGDLGLTITDQDMQNYLNSQFEPSNAPILRRNTVADINSATSGMGNTN